MLAEVRELKERETAQGRALILLGMASRQLEDGAVDAALANLRDAAQAAPDLAEAQYALARALVQARAAGSEAEDALLRAVKLDPRNARYRYEWARLLLARGDRVTALDQLRQAVALQPSLAAAQAEIGTLALEARDWATAASAYRAALAWQTGDAALHRGLAEALEGLGERAEAALERDAAQQLGPARPSPRS